MSERTLTIAGAMLTMTRAFSAGHVLTEAEAYHLSQTLAENCRNGFASKVKAVVAAGAEATPEQTVALQKDFDKFVADYTFTMGGGRIVDPVEREANRLAGIIVDAQLAKLGKKKSVYLKDEEGKAKYAANIAKVAANPEVQSKAKKSVAEAAKLGASIEF